MAHLLRSTKSQRCAVVDDPDVDGAAKTICDRAGTC